MKYLISFFILFSSLLFANKLNISQKVIDKHFDFCLSDAKKTNKQQNICKEFWIPYATGKITDEDDWAITTLKNDYGFNPNNYRNIGKVDLNNKYTNLLGETKTIQVKDEFGNISTRKVDSASYFLTQRLSRAKTQTEKEMEYVKYYTAILSENGLAIKDGRTRNWNVIALGLNLKELLNILQTTGKIPASFSISMNSKKTKNGMITGTFDTLNVMINIVKYTSIYHNTNEIKSTKMRQLLYLSFLIHKGEIILNTDLEGSLETSIVSLYNNVKNNDAQSAKLLILLARGNKKDVSNYLLSIPDVKQTFLLFRKNLGI